MGSLLLVEGMLIVRMIIAVQKVPSVTTCGTNRLPNIKPTKTYTKPLILTPAPAIIHKARTYTRALKTYGAEMTNRPTNSTLPLRPRRKTSRSQPPFRYPTSTRCRAAARTAE